MATDAAAWMLGELRRSGILYQHVAASEIESRFGSEFVYANERGNLALHKRVLAAFRELTGDKVVWQGGERLWRLREEHDQPERRQQ